MNATANFILGRMKLAMKLYQIAKSVKDSTVKFIIKLNDELIAEVSHIDKGDGKTIFCMPSTTGCGLGCKFCHITPFSDKIINRPLKADEIFEMYKITSSNIPQSYSTLLILYMGMGDPFMNIREVLRSMSMIEEDEKPNFNLIRFAICSMFPKRFFDEAFDLLVEHVYLSLQRIKLHASIHVMGDLRFRIMPNSIPVKSILDMLDLYMSMTYLDTELHYALIEGANDSPMDIERLKKEITTYIDPKRFGQLTLKFLNYNENLQTLSYHKSKSPHLIYEFAKEIMPCKVELYTPPGQDIGASCGQFNSELYLNHNQRRSWVGEET